MIEHQEWRVEAVRRERQAAYAAQLRELEARMTAQITPLELSTLAIQQRTLRERLWDWDDPDRLRRIRELASLD